MSIRVFYLLSAILCLTAARAGSTGAPAAKPRPQVQAQGKAAGVKKAAPKIPQAIQVTDTISDSALLKTKDTLILRTGKVISTLTQARGWAQLKNGKWTSSPNRIPYYEPLYNDPLYDKYKEGTENFSQISMQEAKVNGKTYVLLTLQGQKGYYKDAAETDYRYYPRADYYLIPSAEFAKADPDSLKKMGRTALSLQCDYTGMVSWFFKPDQMLQRIKVDMNQNYKTRHLYDTSVHTYFQFLLHPARVKTFIRFNTALAYGNKDAQPAEAGFNAFEDHFYEVEWEKFRQFLKPALPKR